MSNRGGPAAAIDCHRGNTSEVLRGLAALAEPSDLSVLTCLRHLEHLGATSIPATSPTSPGSHSDSTITVQPLGDQHGDQVARLFPEGQDVSVQITSGRPAGARARDEATLQAISGLMEIHGRRSGVPKRLGIEFVSIATGTLAAQGLLACLVGATRGKRIREVHLSAFAGGLVCMSQYLAAATSPEEWSVPTFPSGVGPPFPSIEGTWFELEALDGGVWKAFWEGLGLRDSLVGDAWLPFAFRYATASCSLPAELHEATRRHSLAHIVDVADAAGASVCPLRRYDEARGRALARSAWVDRHGSNAAPWQLQSFRPNGHPPGRRAHSEGPDSDLPLTGLVIVESTRRVQGPLASLMLQMMGAQVVRIEPPGGDPLRGMPPLAGGCSARFLALNRGKDVIEIDLKAAEGRKAVLDLAQHADVFLHNWAPGKDAQFGLELSDFVQVNPRLLYAHASGWGSGGSNDLPTGTDFMVQAHTGLGDLVNPIDEPPFPSLFTLTDIMGGLVCTEAILAGLLLQARGGGAGRAESSLLSGAMALQAHMLDGWKGEPCRSQEKGRQRWSLLDKPLETALGYLLISAKDAESIRRVYEVCGIDHCGSLADREQALVQNLRRRSALDWEHYFRSVGVPCVVVCTDLAELASDIRTAQLFDHTLGCAIPLSPWRFSR